MIPNSNMDDKVKQIYKENLTYSLYGIIVIFVFQIVFMNEGSLFYDEDGNHLANADSRVVMREKSK